MKEQARPRKKRKRALRDVIAKYEDVGEERRSILRA